MNLNLAHETELTSASSWNAVGRIRLIATLSALSLVLAVAGCQRSDVSGTAAPSGSFVKIVDISPATSASLRVGDRVRVQVEVNYRLTADAGTLSLVVQAADNSSLAHNMEVVQKGSGTLTLVAEFVVPGSNAVQIFTPLSAQGQTATSTVDSRAYKVVGK